MNVRSVCALLACVIVNDPFPAVIYVVANAPAALAVVGVIFTQEPEAQFELVTAVVVVLVVSVTVP